MLIALAIAGAAGVALVVASRREATSAPTSTATPAPTSPEPSAPGVALGPSSPDLGGILGDVLGGLNAGGGARPSEEEVGDVLGDVLGDINAESVQPPGPSVADIGAGVLAGAGIGAGIGSAVGSGGVIGDVAFTGAGAVVGGAVAAGGVVIGAVAAVPAIFGLLLVAAAEVNISTEGGQAQANARAEMSGAVDRMRVEQGEEAANALLLELWAQNLAEYVTVMGEPHGLFQDDEGHLKFALDRGRVIGDVVGAGRLRVGPTSGLLQSMIYDWRHGVHEPVEVLEGRSAEPYLRQQVEEAKAEEARQETLAKSGRGVALLKTTDVEAAGSSFGAGLRRR